MNTSCRGLACGLVLLGLAIILGCTRESEFENGQSVNPDSRIGLEARQAQTLETRLMDFKNSLETEEGRPLSLGEEILEGIVGMSNAQERASCLDRFRTTILSVEFSGNDYRKLRSQLGSAERLQISFLSALFRCGGGLDEDVVFRLDFLKWLRREIDRVSRMASDDERIILGVHVTRDGYQFGLKNVFDLCLREIEEEFNNHCVKKMPPDRVEEVRRQIEAFVGRPIRTNAQILHDRMNRPRPASCRSPTEDDIQVSSGL